MAEIPGGLTNALEALARSDSFVAPAVRRAMELRLFKYPEGELEPDTEEPLLPDDPEELAAHIVEMLRVAMERSEVLWNEICKYTVTDDNLGELEPMIELRSMVETYLTLDSDDPDLLERQHDEILQQKLRFADAVIEEWLKDLMLDAFETAQEERVRRMLGGKAVRFTPLTKEREAEILRTGAAPDQLFAEGFVSGVYVRDDEVTLGVSDNPQETGAIWEVKLWRRDSDGKPVQHEKLEIIEAREV